MHIVHTHTLHALIFKWNVWWYVCIHTCVSERVIHKSTSVLSFGCRHGFACVERSWCMLILFWFWLYVDTTHQWTFFQFMWNIVSCVCGWVCKMVLLLLTCCENQMQIVVPLKKSLYYNSCYCFQCNSFFTWTIYVAKNSSAKLYLTCFVVFFFNTFLKIMSCSCRKRKKIVCRFLFISLFVQFCFSGLSVLYHKRSLLVWDFLW